MKDASVFVRKSPLVWPKDNLSLGYKLTVDLNHPYLKRRGLELETLAEFGVGHCPAGPLQNRIAIPVFNTQEWLVGYAGRIPGEPTAKRSKYKFVTSGYLGTELFNLHRVLRERSGDPIILVTGFFDVMHLWQLGWHDVVGLMDWELKSGQLARLLHHFPTRRFIGLFDETDYGRAARESVMRDLPHHAFVHVAKFWQEGKLVESLTEKELEDL
jgi:DNA primase